MASCILPDQAKEKAHRERWRQKQLRIARSATVCGFDAVLRAEHDYHQDIAETMFYEPITEEASNTRQVVLPLDGWSTKTAVVSLTEEDIQQRLQALKLPGADVGNGYRQLINLLVRT